MTKQLLNKKEAICTARGDGVNRERSTFFCCVARAAIPPADEGRPRGRERAPGARGPSCAPPALPPRATDAHERAPGPLRAESVRFVNCMSSVQKAHHQRHIIKKRYVHGRRGGACERLLR